MWPPYVSKISYIDITNLDTSQCILHTLKQKCTAECTLHGGGVSEDSTIIQQVRKLRILDPRFFSQHGTHTRKKEPLTKFLAKLLHLKYVFHAWKQTQFVFSIFPSGKTRFFKHFFFIIFAGGHCDGLRAPLPAAATPEPHFAACKNWDWVRLLHYELRYITIKSWFSAGLPLASPHSTLVLLSCLCPVEFHLKLSSQLAVPTEYLLTCFLLWMTGKRQDRLINLSIDWL